MLADAWRRRPPSHLVGITGAPGSGKSTLTNALIATWRALDRRVGVVAVDPSSPFTGGALLGDRIRMQEHVGDPDVFIRSMSSRGRLGGLADTTAALVTVLGAAGFDPVVIETVGVGQSEVEVVHHADTVVVVLTPGWGDGVQADKAGILEIADVFAINKADRGSTTDTRRWLESMLEMAPDTNWEPPDRRHGRHGGNRHRRAGRCNRPAPPSSHHHRRGTAAEGPTRSRLCRGGGRRGHAAPHVRA